MKTFKYIIIALLIISLGSSFFILGDKIKAEENNKSLGFNMDYHDLIRMAQHYQVDIKGLLRELEEMGVSSVAVKELILKDVLELDKLSNLYYARELVNSPYWEVFSAEELGPYDVVLALQDRELMSFVKDQLSRRYGQDLFTLKEHESTYLLQLHGQANQMIYRENIAVFDPNGNSFTEPVKEYYSMLLELPLGYDEDFIKEAKAAGLTLALRPANYFLEDEAIVTHQLEDLDWIKPSLLIFQGEEIFSYKSKETDRFTSFLKEQDMGVGLIESGSLGGNLAQKGITDLLYQLEYPSARIFPITDFIWTKYKASLSGTASNISEVLYRAATERNVRIVYMNRVNEAGLSLDEELGLYANIIEKTEDKLAKHGFEIGPYSTLKPIQISFVSMVLGSFLMIIIGLFLVNKLLPLSKKLNTIFFLVLLGMIMGALSFNVYLTEKLMALMAAILFASLSAYLFVRMLVQIRGQSLDQVIKQGLFMALLTTVIGMVGGIYIANYIGSIRYMLEINIFLGVKVSQLVPLMAFALFYLFYAGSKEEYVRPSSSKELIHYSQSLLNETIKVKHVIIAGIVAVGGFVLLARSGNSSSIGVFPLEQQMRTFLEEILLARPRTKEFLVGVPAIYLALYLSSRRAKHFVFVVGIVASIYFASITNTFSHVHTAFYISVLRTLYSFAIGSVIGLIGIVILHMVYEPIKEKLK